MAIDVKLPEIGDGIESGDVLEVLVREGDVISQDQDIVELETDKATMGVPSPYAGKVVKVYVREGQRVPIGATLITVEAVTTLANGATDASPSEGAAPVQVKPEPRPLTKQSTPTPAPSQPAPVTKSSASPANARPEPDATAADLSEVAAGPAIRRLAREVGVDLPRVTGSGPGGRITREDVLSVVGQASRRAQAAGATDVDEWGPIHVQKMSRIRRTIAEKMHQSWTIVPRVTNFDDADITELEEFRQESKADYAARGIKLTTLPFVIKAVAMALKTHPHLNASLDLASDQIVYKDYVNIGIAVDSERGLVVPSLRNADKLTIPDIARRLAELAECVRGGSFSLDDLRGSTFTISNLGAIGGTYSTPIVNVPEVAILLVGRARRMPLVVNDKIAIRLLMPLSLSYDHRLVDGAMASRFLNDVIGYLNAPSRLLLAP